MDFEIATLLSHATMDEVQLAAFGGVVPDAIKRFFRGQGVQSGFPKDEETLLRLRCIFRDLFDIPGEAVQMSSQMESMEKWDSLRHMSLIAEIERSFDVKFKFAELKKLNSVGGIIGVLREKRARAK
jgi:acyl carrier protein